MFKKYCLSVSEYILKPNLKSVYGDLKWPSEGKLKNAVWYGGSKMMQFLLEDVHSINGFGLTSACRKE